MAGLYCHDPATLSTVACVDIHSSGHPGVNIKYMKHLTNYKSKHTDHYCTPGFRHIYTRDVQIHIKYFYKRRIMS